MQTLLNEMYDLYGYDLVIDYSNKCVPPLSDASWAKGYNYLFI
ncbi:hypothetical protein [Iningainema tapete]